MRRAAAVTALAIRDSAGTAAWAERLRAARAAAGLEPARVVAEDRAIVRTGGGDRRRA